MQWNPAICVVECLCGRTNWFWMLIHCSWSLGICSWRKSDFLCKLFSLYGFILKTCMAYMYDNVTILYRWETMFIPKNISYYTNIQDRIQSPFKVLYQTSYTVFLHENETIRSQFSTYRYWYEEIQQQGKRYFFFLIWKAYVTQSTAIYGITASLKTVYHELSRRQLAGNRRLDHFVQGFHLKTK